MWISSVYWQEGTRHTDVLLDFRHAGYVVLEAGHLVTRLGRVVAKEFSELGPVGRVFVDTELQVLAESLVEFLRIESD